MLVSESAPSLPAPEVSPSPLVAADSPSQLLLGVPSKRNRHAYHLTLVPCIAIAVTAVAVMTLLVLIVLIHRKSRELDEPDNFGKSCPKTLPPCATWKFQEGEVLTRRIFYFYFILSSNISKPVLYLFVLGSFAFYLGWVFSFGRECRLFYVPKIQLQRDKEGNRGV